MTEKYARRTVLASLGVLGTVGLGASSRSLATVETTTQPTDGSSPPTAWPQQRGVPARTGAVPAAAAPGGEFAANSWVSGSAELVFVDEPVVANGAVYRPFILDDRTYRGGVVALDAETGEERWRHLAPEDTGEPGIGRVNGAPAVTDGRLFLISEPGAGRVAYGGLHALDTGTGKISWSKTEGQLGGVPLVYDDTLYVTGDSKIVALDPTTGDVQWMTEEVGFLSDYTGVSDGTLYGMRTYTDSKNELAAWDASDGRLLWTSTVQNGVNVESAAVGSDSLVHTVGGAGTDGSNGVVAYAVSDGSVRWRTTLTPEGKQSRAYLSGPAVANGTVYVATGVRALANVAERGIHATVYALDAASGEVRWTHDTSTVLQGDPSVAGETVFVGGHAAPQEDVRDGSRFPTVHALATADGRERWSYLVTEDLDENMVVNTAATPVPAGGRVYAGIHSFGTAQKNGVFALAASDVPPEATNRPISSDAPVARITTDADVSDLDGGQTITLDGTASTGDIETYEWDLTDSGMFDANGPTVEMTLDFCGALDVTLRVTDAEGRRSSDTITLSTVER